MAPVDPLEIAERLFRAIEAGDVAAVRALYAPDAVIWHNFDREEQTGGETHGPHAVDDGAAR